MQESQIERSQLPTMEQMINDQPDSQEEAESQDNMIKHYQNDL